MVATEAEEEEEAAAANVNEMKTNFDGVDRIHRVPQHEMTIIIVYDRIDHDPEIVRSNDRRRRQRLISVAQRNLIGKSTCMDTFFLVFFTVHNSTYFCVYLVNSAVAGQSH